MLFTILQFRPDRNLMTIVNIGKRRIEDRNCFEINEIIPSVYKYLPALT